MAKGKSKEIMSSEEIVNTYVPKKSIKDIAYNECQKAGFDVQFNSSIIFATVENEEEEKCFRDFLLKKYGKENDKGEKQIPFSFGTTIGEKNRKKEFGVINEECEKEFDEYEDR